MKKNFKKILTTALASVMALGAVIGFDPATVKADDCTATFSLADGDWSFQDWGTGAGASTTVSGAGSYSMSIDTTAGAEGAVVFVVDIPFTADVLKAQNYRVSDLKLVVDGADFAIDTSKIVTGDIEEKGNLRIELFNSYGPTALSEKYDASVSPFDPATLKSSQSIKIDFTLVESDEPAYDAEGKAIKYVGLTGDGNSTSGGSTDEPSDGGSEGPAAFDPAGSYNAYLGLQTPHWTFRDAWNSDNGIDSEVWGQFIYNNDSGEKYGTVTDAVVAGNGTYTVSIKDFGTVFADDFAAESKEIFNLLYISTDIPLSDDIKVTDVKLIIDGSTKHTDATAYLDPDETEYVKILIQNIWNENKAEISYYPAPSQTLEMQFTISGFNYDKAADEPTGGEDTTAATDSNAGANNAADTSADTAEDKADDDGSILPIIIAVVAVVVVAAAVVVVMKKKKAN